MQRRRTRVDFAATRSLGWKNGYKSIPARSFFFFLHDFSFPQTCMRRLSYIITMMKCDFGGSASFRTRGSVKTGDLLLKPHKYYVFVLKAML